MDHDSISPNRSAATGGCHDSKDIQLPNHTAVFSHIAVDVGCCLFAWITFYVVDYNSRLAALWQK